MAKKYAEFFTVSKETMYDTNILPLMKLSALNKGVNFLTLPSQNGQTANTGPQIAIQRLKRTKAVASPQNLATSSKYGDNYVAKLNAIPTLDWDTVETKRGSLFQIGIQVPLHAEWDLDDVNDAFGKAIAAQTENTLLSAEENAILNVWNRAVGASTVAAPTETAIIDLTSPLTTDKKIAIADTLYDTVQSISLLVDEYKAYDNNVVVICHPLIAKAMSELQGMTYYGAPDTFPTGASVKSFLYNGITFYVSNLLNTISGGADATAFVAGAIVMSTEAYANSGFGSAGDITPFDETHFGDRVVGHQYAYLDVIVDSARIKTIGIKPVAAIPVSKKVNA